MPPITLSDIYARVHKGLRKALFDLAYSAGRTDYANDMELAALTEQTADVIAFLQRHAYVEDTFQLPALEARAPGSTGHYHEEHHRIEEEIDRLAAALYRIATIEPNGRMSAGERWYLQLNRFVANYLAHMDLEETSTGPLFLEYCSDDDLSRLFATIMANSAPSDSFLMLKYTIPAIDHDERAGFLGNIRRNAPPAAFEKVMQLSRSILSDSDWQRLQTALA